MTFAQEVFSNKFDCVEEGEVSLTGNVHDFLVDYDAIDVSDVLDIQRYLTVKNIINLYSDIKQVFIVLLSFSSSLATQCVSLGTKPVMTSPTLIDVNSN